MIFRKKVESLLHLYYKHDFNLNYIGLKSSFLVAAVKDIFDKIFLHCKIVLPAVLHTSLSHLLSNLN